MDDSNHSNFVVIIPVNKDILGGGVNKWRLVNTVILMAEVFNKVLHSLLTMSKLEVFYEASSTISSGGA